MSDDLCCNLKERRLTQWDEITIDAMAKPIFSDDLRGIGVIGEDGWISKKL